MCGLTGMIGATPNPSLLRCLVMLNQNRGSQSTGLFDSQGRSYKKAETAMAYVSSKEGTDFLDQAIRDECWVIAAHTRAATRGAPIDKNSHPFEYGEVIGSHNGVIEAPYSYEVDSMMAFDLLSKEEPGAYQKALGDMAGSYVLTWLDKRNQTFYILNWNGRIACVEYGGCLYYSSDSAHLKAATGVEAKAIEQGKVVSFHKKEDGHFQITRHPDFTGKERTRIGYDTAYAGMGRYDEEWEVGARAFQGRGEITEFDLKSWYKLPEHKGCVPVTKKSGAPQYLMGGLLTGIVRKKLEGNLIVWKAEVKIPGRSRWGEAILDAFYQKEVDRLHPNAPLNAPYVIINPEVLGFETHMTDELLEKCPRWTHHV